MKICKDCKKEKDESEFYGVQGDCKECYKNRVRLNRTRNKEYYQGYDKNRQRNSFKRIFGHKYSMMKMSIEGRNSHKRNAEGKKLCSKKEFLNWCNETKSDFMKLYKQWKKSGFERKLTPSIDRIDNNKGYALDNIQWLTLSENIQKNNNGRINVKRNQKGQFVKQN